MKVATLLLLKIGLAAILTAQQNEIRFWTEQNKIYLLQELKRTKQAVITATESLDAKQWHFKPTADAWSIAQVVEHLGLYERIFL